MEYDVAIQWGFALLALLAILFGARYNSRRISRLDLRTGDSFSHLSTRIDDLNRYDQARHNDLKDFFKSEVRRLEERIVRLEQPIIRS